MTPPPDRDQLFISYSHVDRGWVDRLQTMIRPLVRSHGLRLWDDSQIQPGDKWREEIETALAAAKVALLLVSSDFLASEFVTNSELPQLLMAAEEEGLRILWVPLRPSLVRRTPIDAYQALLDPGRPLARMDPVEQEEALVEIALAIEKALAPRLACYSRTEVQQFLAHGGRLFNLFAELEGHHDHFAGIEACEARKQLEYWAVWFLIVQGGLDGLHQSFNGLGRVVWIIGKIPVDFQIKHMGVATLIGLDHHRVLALESMTNAKLVECICIVDGDIRNHEVCNQ